MKKTIFAAIVIIVLIAIYFFFFNPTPQIPVGGACQSDADCSALDCKGVGPWYCDKDGFPHCAKDNVCRCSFACL